MVSNTDRRLWTAALGLGLGALIWAGAAHRRLGQLESQDRLQAPAIRAASASLMTGLTGLLGIDQGSGPDGSETRFGDLVAVPLPASGTSYQAAKPAATDGLVMLWVTCKSDAGVTLTGEVFLNDNWTPLARISMNGNRSVASGSMSLPVPRGSRWRVVTSGGGGKGFAQTEARGAVWVPLADIGGKR